jgi:hypothetical protein
VGEWIEPRRHRESAEAKTQKQICNWLVGIGAIYAVTDAGILSKMGLGMRCGVPTGWPDLTCCLPGGRFLGIEVKAPKGKQSDDQLAMQAQIENKGGLYIVARSLDDVLNALRKEKLLESLI